MKPCRDAFAVACGFDGVDDSASSRISSRIWAPSMALVGNDVEHIGQFRGLGVVEGIEWDVIEGEGVIGEEGIVCWMGGKEGMVPGGMGVAMNVGLVDMNVSFHR